MREERRCRSVARSPSVAACRRGGRMAVRGGGGAAVVGVWGPWVSGCGVGRG